MNLAFLEASALFFLAHRKPEFDDMHAASNELPLELGNLLHEVVVFGFRAKTHYSFHACAVVPGAIEQHDFARCRQVLHVSLEVPLTAFGLGRLFEGDDSCATRVHMLHKAFDGAAFAGSVSSFEQDHQTLTGLTDPRLQ